MSSKEIRFDILDQIKRKCLILRYQYNLDSKKGTKYRKCKYILKRLLNSETITVAFQKEISDFLDES
jgi:hypothetical protein